jgi:hypothetical protein
MKKVLATVAAAATVITLAGCAAQAQPSGDTGKRVEMQQGWDESTPEQQADVCYLFDRDPELAVETASKAVDGYFAETDLSRFFASVCP